MGGMAARTKRRGHENVTDMLRSLGLVLGVVLVVALFFQSSGDGRPAADETLTINVGTAARAASFQVLVPQGLPDGWTATSSRVTLPDQTGGPVALHVGYLTPTSTYAGLEQSDQPAEAFIASVTRQAQPVGTVPVDGETWQLWRNDQTGDTALTRTQSGRTVVVVGGATREDLTRLADALQPLRSTA